VKFVSITHSERNIWNGPIVAAAISREKRIPVLEGNGNRERHTRHAWRVWREWKYRLDIYRATREAHIECI
jgi:hypothetical protein